MPTNEFLPFAVGVGANVLSQSAYAADPATNLGISAGTAISAKANKTWRQSSFWAAVLGQFINNVGQLDALDNGDVNGALNNFITALTAHLQLHLTTNAAVFATAGTFSWTVPVGVYRVLAIVQGGGAGGGGGQGSASWSSGGGGSGGYARGYYAVTPGQVIIVIVGVGGAGAAEGSGVAGSNGGTSSFGSFCSATGGTGGSGSATTSPGGGPGLGSGGTELNLYGSNGGDGNPLNNLIQGGGGGASAFGGGGRTATFNASPANGLAPGSGGGGIWGTGLSANNGGSGAPGIVIIEWSA